MNRVILQFAGEKQYTFPINEDFTIEAVSEFGSFGDMCPTISTLVDVGNMLAGTGGTVGKAGLELRSILDAPRWTKTNPVKITLDIFFYTENNAKTDVVEPLNFLLGTHILNKDANGIMRIPGVNAKNAGQMNNIIADLGDNVSAETKSAAGKAMARYVDNQKNSVCSVLIPGVVFLDAAYIMAVTPTYSKHVTEKGYPLWASANVILQGIIPAFAEQFERGANMGETPEGTITTTGFTDAARG